MQMYDRVASYKWLRAAGVDPDGCGIGKLSDPELARLVTQIKDAITAQVVAAVTAAAR